MFYLPPPPGAKYFDCLVANIEKLFETGKAPYPVERTLLTAGILDAPWRAILAGVAHRNTRIGGSLQRPRGQRLLPVRVTNPL